MSRPRRPEVAVGGVVLVADHLLLVERARPPAAGLWSIPGGRVETGETLSEAVVREVAEETGLEVACARFLGWVERIGADYHFLIMDFLAVPTEDPADTLPELVAGDDAAAARWIRMNELSQYPLVDGLAGFLAEHGIL